MLHAALLLTGEDVQPERRVCRRRRTEQANPVVEDLEQRPTDGSSRDGPVVEILTLHEDVGATWIPAERGHLAPESSIDEGQVQVSDGLALDHSITYGVVADRKCDDRE